MILKANQLDISNDVLDRFNPDQFLVTIDLKLEVNHQQINKPWETLLKPANSGVIMANSSEMARIQQNYDQNSVGNLGDLLQFYPKIPLKQPSNHDTVNTTRVSPPNKPLPPKPVVQDVPKETTADLFFGLLNLKLIPVIYIIAIISNFFILKRPLFIRIQQRHTIKRWLQHNPDFSNRVKQHN